MPATYETSLAPISVVFNAAGETETHAFDAGSGSNRVLLVCVCWRDQNNTISSVTYNGVSMTAAGAKVTAATSLSAQLFSLASPASGSNNIAVVMGSGLGNSGGLIGAWVANSVDQTTPVDGYTSSSSNGTTATAVSNLTISSAANDRVVVFHCHRNDTVTPTATPTNYTERQDGNTGGGISMEFGDADGASSVATTATWSNGVSGWALVAVGINVKDNAGGGGTTQNLFYRRRR